MTTHGSVAGNKDVKDACVVDVDEDGVQDAEVEKKKICGTNYHFGCSAFFC